jgi:hypothetical protein
MAARLIGWGRSSDATDAALEITRSDATDAALEITRMALPAARAAEIAASADRVIAGHRRTKAAADRRRKVMSRWTSVHLGGDRDARYDFALSLGAEVAERKGEDWDVCSTLEESSVEMDPAYHTWRDSGRVVLLPGAAIRAGHRLDYHRAVRTTWLRSAAWIDGDGTSWYLAHDHLYRLPRGDWTQGKDSLALDGRPVSGLDLAAMAADRGEVYPHLGALLLADPRLVRDVIARRTVSAKRLMSVPDAHLRGYIAERCGGLARVASRLPLVERTEDGELRDASRIGMTTDLLIVRDSTSGERFALGVPRRRGRARTVRRALRDLNGIAQTKIIAQS